MTDVIEIIANIYANQRTRRSQRETAATFQKASELFTMTKQISVIAIESSAFAIEVLLSNLRTCWKQRCSTYSL